MTTSNILLSGLAVAAILSAAAPALAETPVAVDASATAAASSYVQMAQTDLTRHRLTSARDDVERAETDLLNKAEYDGTVTINPGTGMVLRGPLEDLNQARHALQDGRLRQAAIALTEA
jgi:hypothetical protein